MKKIHFIKISLVILLNACQKVIIYQSMINIPKGIYLKDFG